MCSAVGPELTAVVALGSPACPMISSDTLLCVSWLMVHVPFPGWCSLQTGTLLQLISCYNSSACHMAGQVAKDVFQNIPQYSLVQVKIKSENAPKLVLGVCGSVSLKV